MAGTAASLSLSLSYLELLHGKAAAQAGAGVVLEGGAADSRAQGASGGARGHHFGLALAAQGAAALAGCLVKVALDKAALGPSAIVPVLVQMHIGDRLVARLRHGGSHCATGSGDKEAAVSM